MDFETVGPDPATYFDRVAGTAAGRAYKRIAREQLALAPGQSVVELGCGPATDLAALADAVGESGSVVALDHDAMMVARARERMAGRPAVDVRQADVHALPLPDRCADRAHVDRVLQYVAEPARVLREVRRVLRPGGRFVGVEPDWYTLTIDHSDLDAVAAYTRFHTERVVPNPAVGRQLPRLAAEAGLTVVDVLPFTRIYRDVQTADQILGLQRNATDAVEAGYLSGSAAEDLLASAARGPFFASITLYLTAAERPRS